MRRRPRLIPKPADIEIVFVGYHASLRHSVGDALGVSSATGVSAQWYIVRISHQRGLLAIRQGGRWPWWRRLLNRLLPPTYWEWP